MLFKKSKLFQIFKKECLVLMQLVLVSTLVSILEGVGIAVFLPILQTQGTANSLQIPFPFNQVVAFFAQFSFERRILWVALILVLINLIKFFLMYCVILLSLVIRTRVIETYSVVCMQRLMELRMGFYNKKHMADFQNMIKNKIEFHMGLFAELICNVIPAFVTTIFLMAVLFLFSWQITLVSLGILSIASVALSILSKKIRKLGEQYFVEEARFNKVIFDIIHGMKTIRLFNMQGKMLKDFQVHVGQIVSAYTRSSIANKLIGPVFELTGVLMLAFIMILGALWSGHFNKDTMLMTIFAFIVVLARLVPALKQLNNARGAILTRIPVLTDIERFLETTVYERLPEGKGSFHGLKDKIEFKNVTFSYGQENQAVLQNVSFEIKKGEKIGVVGISGSGKSTIIELLLRFYDPQQGMISIDGVDLKEFDVRFLRQSVGVVAQDTFLFGNSVLANIAFSNVQMTDDQVMAAARLAHADEFIQKMPSGYQTIIGDRGVLISGGQRQRIAIARAILNNPDILIFDEATSALDASSERIVQETFEEISAGKTVITISHRLSTIIKSDRIIVIHQGRIWDVGHHQALLERCEIYRELFGLQVISHK